MIITRTPLSLTLVGEGLDSPKIIKNTTNNLLITAALNKFIYTTVNKRVEKSIRASYRTTEYVSHVAELKHDIIRNSLKTVGLKRQIEITTIAEITSRGTSLGSNSSLTVGLISALYAHKEKYCDPKILYTQATKVDKKSLGSDFSPSEVISAIRGGINYLEFSGKNNPLIFEIVARNDTFRKLRDHLLLLSTGIEYSGDNERKSFLESFERGKKGLGLVERLNSLTEQFRQNLSLNKVEPLGQILDESWHIKKQLIKGESDINLDRLYETARKHGAEGGKFTGVGTRGCLLLFADPIHHGEIIHALDGLKKIDFSFDFEGVKTVFNSHST